MLKPGSKKVRSQKTVLITDNASRTGLGYVIIQTDEKVETDASAGGLFKKMPKGNLISCGLHYINSAKKKHAMIELEILALQWASKKGCLYLLGARHKSSAFSFNCQRLKP